MFSAGGCQQLAPTDATTAYLTSPDGRRVDVEGHRNRGAAAVAAGARRAGRGGSEAGGTPAGRREARTSLEGGERRGVGPGEVGSAGDGAVAPAVLFGQATVRGRVLGVHLEEAIGKRLDGRGQRREGRRGRGVGAGGDGGRELLEEGERGGGDVERAELVPDDQSIVELLSDGEGGEVPGVTAVVRVLGVAASSDGSVGSNTAVDCVDGTERVDVDLEVGEGLVRARLEGEGVASRSSVERVDGGEDGVSVLARSAAARVCGDVSTSRVPVALNKGSISR